MPDILPTTPTPEAVRPAWPAVFAALLVGAGVTFGVMRAFTPPPPPPDAVVTVDRSSPVVTAIRDLSRLQTAEYHMERVIQRKESQKRLFGLIQADDAILLVAAADVSAGVDLSQLKDSDITVDWEKKSARIRLPAPEVFEARLDSKRTVVHSRETDLLATRKETLESKARAEAEKQLREAARKAGILERARSGAKKTVESLVRSLGYTQVDVTFVGD